MKTYGGTLSISAYHVNSPMVDLDFLWQDPTNVSYQLAKKIAKVNPSMFVVNIDGPNSNPGPTESQLVSFVTTLISNGYTGSLVYHPDATKADYSNDWSRFPHSTNESYKAYIDWLEVLNTSLLQAKLPTFKGILIETQSS